MLSEDDVTRANREARERETIADIREIRAIEARLGEAHPMIPHMTLEEAHARGLSVTVNFIGVDKEYVAACEKVGAAMRMLFFARRQRDDFREHADLIEAKWYIEGKIVGKNDAERKAALTFLHETDDAYCDADRALREAEQDVMEAEVGLEAVKDARSRCKRLMDYAIAMTDEKER